MSERDDQPYPARRTSHLAVAAGEPERPVPVDAATSTIVSVVTEAADEVVAEFFTDGDGRPSVAFVPSTEVDDCSTVVECVVLGPLLGLDEQWGGHLHLLVRPPHPEPGEPVTTIPFSAATTLLSAIVTRDLLDVELARARHDTENLRLALEHSRTIGVAMGVLMATFRVDREQAFAMLRSASQRQNRKLREVAAGVEYTGEIAGSSATA